MTARSSQDLFPWTTPTWVLASWATYAVAFWVLFPVLGPPVGAIALVPIAWTAWSTGWRGGVVAGIVNAILTDALLVAFTGLDALTVAQNNLLGQGIFAWLGATMGAARDYTDHVLDQNARLERAQEALGKRDIILSTAAGATTRLLRDTDWEAGAGTILRGMGEAMGLVRVTLYRAEAGPGPDRAEASDATLADVAGATRADVAEDGPPETLAPVAHWHKDPAMPAEAVHRVGIWQDLLWMRLLDGQAAQVSLGNQDGMAHSLAAVPIRVQDTWWGALIFEDARPSEAWSRTEIDALHVLAGMVGAAIQQQDALRLEAKTREQRVEVEKLQAAERFKTQFLNNAAHEMSTPLTPLLLQLAVLERNQKNLDEKQRRSVAVLSRNLHRVRRLVQDLLDAARVQNQGLTLKPEPIDMATLVQETVESFGEGAGSKAVQIHVDEGSSRNVVADEMRIGQVLFNLLSNAVKFSPDGGTIHVRLADRGDGVEVEVRDDGMGFEPHRAGEAFLPFSRLHEGDERDPGGSGLGLYISQAIVEAHGGTLEAESAGAGKGARFRMHLPKDGKVAPSDTARRTVLGPWRLG